MKKPNKKTILFCCFLHTYIYRNRNISLFAKLDPLETDSHIRNAHRYSDSPKWHSFSRLKYIVIAWNGITKLRSNFCARCFSFSFFYYPIGNKYTFIWGWIIRLKFDDFVGNRSLIHRILPRFNEPLFIHVSVTKTTSPLLDWTGTNLFKIVFASISMVVWPTGKTVHASQAKQCQSEQWINCWILQFGFHS